MVPVGYFQQGEDFPVSIKFSYTLTTESLIEEADKSRASAASCHAYSFTVNDVLYVKLNAKRKSNVAVVEITFM